MRRIAVLPVGVMNFPKTYYLVFYFEGAALPDWDDIADIPEIRLEAQKGRIYPKPGDIFLFKNPFSDPVKRY